MLCVSKFLFQTANYYLISLSNDLQLIYQIKVCNFTYVSPFFVTWKVIHVDNKNNVI